MLLEAKQLCKSFGEIKAVDGVTLSIDEGERIGLLGPNGAGKSTTVSMIATLLVPDGGEIIYKGKNAVKHPQILRKELGYVPQDIALYPMLSGIDNMKFWGKAYGLRGATLKQAIERAADITGLKERLKDPVKNYSGGMKRRLNIAVALLHSPKLLILDEPTVGIDPQSRNHILETVKMLNHEGMAVIYISHYMEEVEAVCKRTYIMDHGHVIAEGNHDELVQVTGTKRPVKFTMSGDQDKMLDVIATWGQADYHDGTFTLELDNDTDILRRLGNAASGLNGEILSMQVEEPTLETVFLKLTGRALRD